MDQQDYLSTANQTDTFKFRSETELVSMMITKGVLVFIRFIVIFYFVLMSIQHSKYQGEKKDKYTYLTFLFLAISETCLNLTLLSWLVQEISEYLTFKDPD